MVHVKRYKKLTKKHIHFEVTISFNHQNTSHIMPNCHLSNHPRIQCGILFTKRTLIIFHLEGGFLVGSSKHGFRGYPPVKLTYPLKMYGWKMNIPFKMVPFHFREHSLIFWGVTVSLPFSFPIERSKPHLTPEFLCIGQL